MFPSFPIVVRVMVDIAGIWCALVTLHCGWKHYAK